MKRLCGIAIALLFAVTALGQYAPITINFEQVPWNTVNPQVGNVKFIGGVITDPTPSFNNTKVFFSPSDYYGQPTLMINFVHEDSDVSVQLFHGIPWPPGIYPSLPDIQPSFSVPLLHYP